MNAIYKSNGYMSPCIHCLLIMPVRAYDHHRQILWSVMKSGQVNLITSYVFVIFYFAFVQYIYFVIYVHMLTVMSVFADWVRVNMMIYSIFNMFWMFAGSITRPPETGSRRRLGVLSDLIASGRTLRRHTWESRRIKNLTFVRSTVFFAAKVTTGRHIVHSINQ